MSRRPPNAPPARQAAPPAECRRFGDRSAASVLALLAAASLLLTAPTFAQSVAPSDGSTQSDGSLRTGTTTRQPLGRTGLTQRAGTASGLRGSLGPSRADEPPAADPFAGTPGFSDPATTAVDPDPLGPSDPAPVTPALTRVTPSAPTVTGTTPAIDPATGRPIPVKPNPSQARGAVQPVVRAGSVTDGGPVPSQPAVQPTPRDLQAAKREEASKDDDDYTQLGLRTGGFTWLPAIETSAGGTTNVSGGVGGKSGAVWRVAPELLGRSDWSQHSLEIELRGAYSGNSVDTQYDHPSLSSALRGRIDLGDATRIDVKAGLSYDRQTPSSVADPAATLVPATLKAETASLGITRDVGLLALTLRGDVERDVYSGGLSTSGSSLGSDIQNNTRWVGAFRTTLGSQSTFRPFVELQVTARRYDDALVAGQPRDSTGAAAKVGVVTDFGPKLRGEVSTGWGVERPDQGPLADISGWLVDGSLVWSPTRLTTVRLDAKTSFDPTTLSGVTGSVGRTVGVAVEQSLRRDLVASAGISLLDRRYVGQSIHETDVALSSGLTYKVNRNLQTFVRGSVERFNSTLPGSDYDAATVMVGVRVQR